MENRKVYLIRHGKVEAKNNERRYIGQLDLPLSDEGIEQARRLQKILEPMEISRVVCSDLSRSQQTAQIVAGDKKITVRKELREIHMGEWEGRSFSEIAKRFPGEFEARGADIGYYRVSGGESFADCNKRVNAVFHEIMNASSGDVLFVGHAGVNRLLLSGILGMPLANIFKIRQDYGCLNVITGRNSSYQVELVNFRFKI